MVLTQWETLCGLFFCFFEKIVVPILTSGGQAEISLTMKTDEWKKMLGRIEIEGTDNGTKE